MSKFRLLQGPISDYDRKVINEELDSLNTKLNAAVEDSANQHDLWLREKEYSLKLKQQIKAMEDVLKLLRKNLADRASLQCDNFDAISAENDVLKEGIKNFANIDNWIYCNPYADGSKYQSIKWVGEGDPRLRLNKLLERI